MGAHSIDRLLYLMDLRKANRHSPQYRLLLALRRIIQIANACLVITLRLHVALPAVALGVPTILINRNLNNPKFTRVRFTLARTGRMKKRSAGAALNLPNILKVSECVRNVMFYGFKTVSE